MNADVDAGGCRKDNHVVWGVVNDGLIYHHVNAAEPKAPNGSGEKQLPLRVYLPHHELIGCLQEQVNPQAEAKHAVDLYHLQQSSTLEQFTAKTTYDDVPLPVARQELSSFKSANHLGGARIANFIKHTPVGLRKVEF